jgi:SAM-dependent methyltransferase
MADLRTVRSNWEVYARTDPMWAILMDPAKRHGKWDPRAFFDSGIREITTVLNYVEGQGLSVDYGGVAVDFGCGVGRLSQALAARFRRVVGIDISAEMVKRAEGFNRFPESCSYVHNTQETIERLDSGVATFVYTSIVLQHMEPRFSVGYLREFARILRPGGVLVAQLPDTLRSSPKTRVARFRSAIAFRHRVRRLIRRSRLWSTEPSEDATYEMHCVPQAEVTREITGAGMRLIDVQLTNSTNATFGGRLEYLKEEPVAGYVSKQYCAIRLDTRA